MKSGTIGTIDNLAGKNDLVADLESDFRYSFAERHRLRPRAGPKIEFTRHQPRQAQWFEQPRHRQILAIGHEMRLVVMPQYAACMIHRGHRVARGNQLTFFVDHQPVAARDQNITCTHQRHQPLPRAQGALAGLELIKAEWITRFEIIRDGRLGP